MDGDRAFTLSAEDLGRLVLPSPEPCELVSGWLTSDPERRLTIELRTPNGHVLIHVPFKEVR